MSQLAEDMLIEFLNTVEEGIAAAKQRYKENKGITDENEPSWNPKNIKWQSAEGSHGPYERSEDTGNPDCKALLKDLADHQGKLTHDGYFYWTFKNGSTIGRKKRET